LRQLGKIGGWTKTGTDKKWGLVMAKFADQKPRPQICVVSKVTFDQREVTPQCHQGTMYLSTLSNAISGLICVPGSIRGLG
jgi:hypothetical protein